MTSKTMNCRTVGPAKAERQSGKTPAALPAMPAGCARVGTCGRAHHRQKGPTRRTRQNGPCVSLGEFRWARSFLRNARKATRRRGRPTCFTGHLRRPWLGGLSPTRDGWRT
eukprot:3470713-Lingulodinium_polyedra.AAC.1